MASWRDDASPQAQRDLDELLNVALGFAQQELSKHGEFYPYAAALGTDGSAEMIAGRPAQGGEHPQTADVIDACIFALATKRAQIRAGVVVANVHLPELGGDAVEVDLEHVEGQALTVLLPYTKKRFRKDISYGPLRVQAGHRRIWANS